MQGFPPPPEQRVTLGNWQLPPYHRWSFHHVREVVPTARVARGTGLSHPLTADAARSYALTGAPMSLGGAAAWIGGLLAVFIPLCVWRYRRMS